TVRSRMARSAAAARAGPPRFRSKPPRPTPGRLRTRRLNQTRGDRGEPERLVPLARACLVDAQRAPADVLAVQLSDGCLRFLLVGHFDEAESARPSRLAIHQDLDGRHFAVRCEGFAKLAL